jgi:hypothetical protein
MRFAKPELNFSEKFLNTMQNAGFKTVEEYVEKSENVPLHIAEEYITAVMSYPWYSAKGTNNNMYSLFYNASSWEDANRLAGTVKKHFTPKPSMVEPNGRIYREYETFHNFITPRLLINKHAPTEHITQVYGTTNFDVYNPKEENHPLNIITSHANTSPHILKQIAYMPNIPYPTNQVEKVAQQTTITFNIIQNLNTPYEVFIDSKFHEKITSQILAKMFILTLTQRAEYDVSHLKALIYGTNNKHILNEIKTQTKKLNLDETEQVFIVLGTKTSL